MISQKLPDPHGFIRRIKGKLNKRCAVRQSPFCDVIISMRMQGVPFRDIETFLVDQGEGYRISSPTICKNFKQTRMEVKLTYAEEMLEKMGGIINLDLIREASQNIILQKERVDRLVRREEIIQTKGMNDQKANPAYLDRRVKGELELLNNMIRQLHAMLEKTSSGENVDPEVLNKMEAQELHMTEDVAQVLADMIINDELVVGPVELLPPG